MHLLAKLRPRIAALLFFCARGFKIKLWLLCALPILPLLLPFGGSGACSIVVMVVFFAAPPSAEEPFLRRRRQKSPCVVAVATATVVVVIVVVVMLPPPQLGVVLLPLIERVHNHSGGAETESDGFLHLVRVCGAIGHWLDGLQESAACE